MAETFIGPLLQDGTTGEPARSASFFEPGGGFENLVRSYSLYQQTRAGPQQQPAPTPAQQPAPVYTGQGLLSNPIALVGLGMIGVLAVAAVVRR